MVADGAVGHPGFQRIDRLPGSSRLDRQAHHRFIIAHQGDRLLGADALLRADRQIDGPQALRAAVDEVAEKHDRPARGAARFARRGRAARRGDRRARECRRWRKSRRRARPSAATERLAIDDDGHKEGVSSPERSGLGGDPTIAPARAGFQRLTFASARSDCAGSPRALTSPPCFLSFFTALRQANVPVTLREYLT